MTYLSIALSAQLPSGQQAGSVEVSAAAVEFVSGEIGFRMPLAGLQIRFVGTGDLAVLLTHESNPGLAISVTDSSILKDAHFLADEAIRAQIARMRRRKIRRWIPIAGCLTLAIISLLVLIRSRAPLVAYAARRVPPSVEEEIGRTAFDDVIPRDSIVGDAAIREPLQSVVDRLRISSGIERYAFEVHTVEADEINAFALPGGLIVINTGLLLEAESSEEIAGVLAHEMAHVAEQHSLRHVINAFGLITLVQIMFGDASSLALIIAEGGAILTTLRFSREAETDADVMGVDYLLAAEIDPRGLVSFFDRLRSLEESEDLAEPLPFISTHPATARRIEVLEERIEELITPSFSGRFDFDLEAVQNAIADRARE